MVVTLNQYIKSLLFQAIGLSVKNSNGFSQKYQNSQDPLSSTTVSGKTEGLERKKGVGTVRQSLIHLLRRIKDGCNNSVGKFVCHASLSSIPHNPHTKPGAMIHIYNPNAPMARWGRGRESRLLEAHRPGERRVAEATREALPQTQGEKRIILEICPLTTTHVPWPAHLAPHNNNKPNKLINI